MFNCSQNLGFIHHVHHLFIHMFYMKAPATTRDMFEATCFKVEAHATSTAGSFFLLKNGICCFGGFVLRQFLEKTLWEWWVVMNVLLWMWMCSMMYECLINVLFVWWPDFEDVWKMFGFGLCFNASTTEWFPLHLETCSRWVHKKKCHGVFQPLENAGRKTMNPSSARRIAISRRKF